MDGDDRAEQGEKREKKIREEDYADDDKIVKRGRGGLRLDPAISMSPRSSGGERRPTLIF